MTKDKTTTQTAKNTAAGKEQSLANLSQQLLNIADRLTALAKLMESGESPSQSANCGVQKNNDALSSQEEKTEKANKPQKHENPTQPQEAATEAKSAETPQTDKSKTTTQTAENKTGRQIGGGLNGMAGNLNLKNLPGLGNLFGGLGGLGGLGMGGAASLAGKMPQSVEELQNNPQMMAMLSSLENNPSLLNTAAAISGMDKEQILTAIKGLQSTAASADADTTTEKAAASAAPAANPLGNLNLNSLGDLSKLFGGQNPAAGMGGMGSPTMPANAVNTAMPPQMPTGAAMSVGGAMPLRGTIGGDPLTNLLNQWHWTPLRS